MKEESRSELTWDGPRRHCQLCRWKGPQATEGRQPLEARKEPVQPCRSLDARISGLQNGNMQANEAKFVGTGTAAIGNWREVLPASLGMEERKPCLTGGAPPPRAAQSRALTEGEKELNLPLSALYWRKSQD